MSLFHVSFKKFLLTTRETRGRLLFPQDKQHRKRLFSWGLWLLSITFHTWSSNSVPPLSVTSESFVIMEERVLCVVHSSGIMMEGFIVYKLNSLCYRIFPMDQPPEVIVSPPLLPTEHRWCSSRSVGGLGLSVSLCFLTAQSLTSPRRRGSYSPPRRRPEPSHSEGERLLHRPESLLVTVEIQVWKSGHKTPKYLGVKMLSALYYTISKALLILEQYL